MNKPINLTELLVEQVLKEQLNKKANICKCDKCTADMSAYALNHLAPHYVVTNKGEAITRASTLNSQVSIDYLVEVSKAIEHIAKNPRH